MKQRVKTILFIGLALIALFGMTGCPQAAKPEEPPAPPSYTTVAYAKLAEYLQKLPAGTATHYIEVTGLKKEHLNGNNGSGTLRSILQIDLTKKVALKLPKTVEGLTDMSNCFLECKNLVSVANIPSGVTNMRYCFDGCTSLKQASVIPEGVTNMEACFRGCTSLTKAPTIPNSVTDMKHCFDSCTALKQVPSISNTVTNMNDCFSDCTNLTTVPSIPAAVTNMVGCFANCTKLTSVTLKCNYNPAQYQGNPVFGNAFAGCTELKAGSIKVPKGQLSAYQAGAGDMGTTADRFAEE